ncbi:MAG: hypothetical protein IT239_03635 [Bacteroidia bacterium]|nr:hypothetical protein [Bacteroidia bacterium]
MEYKTGIDTRIGYPNEHLTQDGNELSSPMYATGVGLVIKGLQHIEKKMQKEVKLINQTPSEEPIATIADHSNKNKKGAFFEMLKNIFKEDPQ